jgi:SAM-dependent methyltransferase
MRAQEGDGGGTVVVRPNSQRSIGPISDFFETSYGVVKRAQVFSKWIEAFKRREGRQTVSILDFGCGTGSTVTRPLGGGGDQILGVDAHQASVEVAERQNSLRNVRYRVGGLPDLLNGSERFDVIICSEVLEHLSEPESYVRGFRSLLNSPGILILSIPNGYGPFEQLKALEQRLDDLGIDWILVWMGQAARRAAIRTLERLGRRISPPVMGTLDQDSPHVNFFRLHALEEMCRREGFVIRETRGRSLICGPYADFWLNRWPFRLLLPLNNALADWLPLRFCSDWMLLLQKEDRDN